MVRETQLAAAGRLVGEGLAGVVATVGDVHRAVGHRVQRALPAGGRAVAAVQSGVADMVYSGVAEGTRIVPGLVVALVGRGRDEMAVAETGLSGGVVAAIKGIWGDTVAARYPELAVPPTLRVLGRDLRMYRVRAADDVRDPTGRIVVFVHGLAENDWSWWQDAGRAGREAELSPRTASYGERLRADLDYTPLYFHYNSGLRVSVNGRALAEALERLVEVWPVPVERIALIGHSMGGLLVRSACRQGQLEGHRWVAAVGTVVTLGTPHLGAPLEKAVHVAERLLAVLPESVPFARLLGSRSVGVQDLRFGALVEDDWRGLNRSALLQDSCTDTPLLKHAVYSYVSASVTSNHRHPVGWLFGDGLVRHGSAGASGRTRRGSLAPQHRVHLSRLNHFSLLNHPAVYDHIRSLLTLD